MLGLFFLTPVEIVAGCLSGVLTLLGLGTSGNRNRKPGGKRGKKR